MKSAGFWCSPHRKPSDWKYSRALFEGPERKYETRIFVSLHSLLLPKYTVDPPLPSNKMSSNISNISYRGEWTTAAIVIPVCEASCRRQKIISCKKGNQNSLPGSRIFHTLDEVLSSPLVGSSRNSTDGSATLRNSTVNVLLCKFFKKGTRYQLNSNIYTLALATTDSSDLLQRK